MENKIIITTEEIHAISQLSILFKSDVSAIGLSPNHMVCWEGDYGMVHLHLGENKITTIGFRETEPLMAMTLFGIITTGSFTYEELY